MEKTKVLSTHYFRRKAREEERDIQRTLDIAYGVIQKNPEKGVIDGIGRLLEANGIPGWARGVRVDKHGWAQWDVVATEKRGH